MFSSRLAAAGGVILAGLMAAACGSAQGPGWTYQPAASVTPAPSVSAEASGSAAPSGGGGGVAIAAQGVQFDVDELVAPADTEFQIAFDNQDQGVPHDVDVRDSGGDVLDDNEIVTGPTQTTYDVPALPAGEYVFICSVHPNMTGTLIAE
jgi:plastocyanin